MNKRPVIGVTLDAEQPGGYSKYPWYAIRQNYADAIVAAGGLPIALPHDASLAADYLDRIDALVVTGGAFDVDPALYGDTDRHATVTLKEGRTAAETALTSGALARNMPYSASAAASSSGGGPGRHADPAHPRFRRGRTRARAAKSAPRARSRRRNQQRHAAASLRRHRRDAGELGASSGRARSGPYAVVNAVAPGYAGDQRHRGRTLPLTASGVAVASRVFHRSQRPTHLRYPDRRLPAA